MGLGILYTPIIPFVGAMQEEDCPRCKKNLNRLTKLRNWRDEAMTGAIEAVKGVNYAVAKFGEPASMLRDSLSGRVTHGSKATFIVPRRGQTYCIPHIIIATHNTL